MPNRARQFLPFDALTGFREALELQERLIESRKELMDDYKYNLNEKISKIRVGDLVKVKYYYEIEYIETIGKVKRIDNVYKKIYVADSALEFDDIIDIESYT